MKHYPRYHKQVNHQEYFQQALLYAYEFTNGDLEAALEYAFAVMKACWPTAAQRMKRQTKPATRFVPKLGHYAQHDATQSLTLSHSHSRSRSNGVSMHK